MQRRVRSAWIAGLSAAGLLAAGCAGTPAPRPNAEDANASEAINVPGRGGPRGPGGPAGPGGDEFRRSPVSRRVEPAAQQRKDPESPRDEPTARPRSEPSEPASRDDTPASPPEGGLEKASPDRGTPPGDGSPAVPRDHRERPDDPGDRDGPTPPPEDPLCPEPDVLTEQADLVHAAATRPSAGASGFAGLALSAADCRIDLWWKGPVSATVITAIESVDGVHGLHVVTHDAAHSAAELAIAADALTAERLVTLPDEAQVTVAIEAVTPRYDGAGIDVEISVDPGSARPGLAERVAASLTERVGVPVFVEVVSQPPVPLGHADEPDPHSLPTGERSYHPVPGQPGTFAACTTGFDVRARDGEGHWLLTADHCTSGADGPAFDGAHAPIGTVTEHRPALDSTRIAVTGTGTGISASADDPPPVRSAAANYPGESVCHGGATSGEVCDLVIRQVDRRQWSEALGTYVQEVVQAERTPGAPAARPGDSGAPVYRTSATGEIDALGILVMGHTGDSLDIPVDTIYYVDIQALLTEWNADLG